jgi:hypothetical protein
VSGVIRWEDPPPIRQAQRPPVHDWPSIIDDLRANPGRWALAVVCVNTTPGPGRGTGSQVRREPLVSLPDPDTYGNRVYSEIAAERRRQDTKWGEQNHPDGTGPRVAFAGRLCYMEDAARDFRLACKSASGEFPNLKHHGPVTWRHILLEEVFEALAEDDPAALRAELVQSAAVLVQWIEAIDRRPSEGNPS